MDWSNEPYVRVYTRETDDDIALSWEARAVWDAAMKRFDRSGIVSTKRRARGLAALIRIPAEVVERALPELLEDGRIREVDGGYIAPNFIAAQEASKSDRFRQKEVRDRRRASVTGRDSNVTKSDSNVTTGHDATEPVTSTHDASHDVTLCSAVHCIADPLPRVALPARAIPGPGQESGPGSEPETVGVAEAKARRDFQHETREKLQSIRLSVAADCGIGEVRPLPLGIEGPLAQRISEAGTIERARADVGHVLAIAEAEARTKNTVEYLHLGMFETASWRKKLGMTLADAMRVDPKQQRGAAAENIPGPARRFRTLR